MLQRRAIPSLPLIILAKLLLQSAGLSIIALEKKVFLLLFLFYILFLKHSDLTCGKGEVQPISFHQNALEDVLTSNLFVEAL